MAPSHSSASTTSNDPVWRHDLALPSATNKWLLCGRPNLADVDAPASTCACPRSAPTRRRSGDHAGCSSASDPAAPPAAAESVHGGSVTNQATATCPLQQPEHQTRRTTGPTAHSGSSPYQTRFSSSGGRGMSRPSNRTVCRCGANSKLVRDVPRSLANSSINPITSGLGAGIGVSHEPPQVQCCLNRWPAIRGLRFPKGSGPIRTRVDADCARDTFICGELISRHHYVGQPTESE